VLIWIEGPVRDAKAKNPVIALDQGAEANRRHGVDRILTIIQLLAKSADDKRLPPLQAKVLNQSIEALIQYDDEFVRRFLAMVRGAHGVLIPDVSAVKRGKCRRPESKIMSTSAANRSYPQHREQAKGCRQGGG
jgi:hypothetical protein